MERQARGGVNDHPHYAEGWNDALADVLNKIATLIEQLTAREVDGNNASEDLGRRTA